MGGGQGRAVDARSRRHATLACPELCDIAGREAALAPAVREGDAVAHAGCAVEGHTAVVGGHLANSAYDLGRRGGTHSDVRAHRQQRLAHSGLQAAVAGAPACLPHHFSARCALTRGSGQVHHHARGARLAAHSSPVATRHRASGRCTALPAGWRGDARDAHIRGQTAGCGEATDWVSALVSQDH